MTRLKNHSMQEFQKRIEKRNASWTRLETVENKNRKVKHPWRGSKVATNMDKEVI